MRKLFAVFVAAAILSFTSSAQKISGIVNDDLGKGLSKTTVTLLKAKDSSVVKYSATDNEGKFSLNAQPGNYLLNVTHVGYTAAYSKPFAVGSSDILLEGIVMIKTEKSLQGVTVSSKKPLVEVKADRMIMNVEGTINAVGNDALELLRKSPGVTIDKDDNISLSGKNGVQVFIDGKPSPLSGTDLANYLKSLQSAQIESIELITNPSAKYEAAGNAGIINIRLKKNKAFGFNGSVNAGYNIGLYPKYNGGVVFNYRYKKVNIFGNYNYSNIKSRNTINLFRTTSADSSFDGQSKIINKNETHGFKAGVDYYAGKKSTVGVMVNGNLTDSRTNTYSKTDIAYMPSKQLERLLIARNESDGNRDNINFNTNYRFADTSGHELNIDLDYGFYKSKSNQYQPNFTYDATGINLLDEETYSTNTPSRIDIYSAKLDYEQNFKKGRLGFGGKVSYVNTDNTLDRIRETYPGPLTDNFNVFNYRENVNALYVNYNRQLKGIMFQAGLRVENTHSKGHSVGFRYDYDLGVHIPMDNLLDRNYTNAFPSAAVTFNKNPMKQWNITYSRRIDRPSYQNLNPFEFNLDKYTFQRGNPNLQPQYTNSFGLTYIYKYKLTTTLNYSHVKDLFSTIPKSEGTDAFITTENAATQNIVSLNVSMPVQYKKYSMFFNINSNYSHYKGDATGFHIDEGVFSVTLYAQQTYKLTKTATLELSGFYITPAIWQGGFKSKSLGSLDGGIQQVILKGKGTVKASVTDLFNTYHWYASNNTTGQIVRADGAWESRQFRINFSYRFGSNQVKQARQRKASIEDEKKRTQDSGGIGVGN